MSSVKKAYRQFLATSRCIPLYNEFKRIIYSEEDSLAKTITSAVLSDLPQLNKDIVDICDIGGGDGKRISAILKALHSMKGMRFRLDLVEQSENFVNSFDPTSLKSFCEVRLFPCNFEEASFDRRYDFVFMIHSIFAFDDPKVALNKVQSICASDGRVIIISNAPNSFLAKIKALLDEGYIDKRYEADALIQDIDDRGMTYNVMKLKTVWEIDQSSLNENLNIILEWLSLGSYQSWSAMKKQKVFEYVNQGIADSLKGGKIVEDEIAIILSPS